MSKQENDTAMKWYFIGFAAFMVASMLGVAHSSGKKADAKRDVLVACYNSGAKDCDTRVAKAFEGD